MTSHAESRDDTRQWLLEFHRHGDALNARRWLEKFWTEDVRLRFAGYPEIQGQENIIKMFEQQFKTLSSMQHEIQYFDVVGNKIYQAARITYGVAGDPEDEKIPIDGFAVFHRRGDKVELFEVFLNPAPLDAGKARVAASRRT